MDLSRPEARASEREWLAGRFQAYRPQLRALAYRMLGSMRDADDAVQETWLRLDRSDAAAISDLRTWLSTVAGRVCLDMLRSRRARRRIRQAPVPDPDLGQQRRAVDAFLAAARHGDFDALVAVLDPDVVFRADLGPGSPRQPLHGARPVARHVLAVAPRFAGLASPITVNGTAGALFGRPGDPIAVIAFTVTHGRIAAIDLISDPDKLGALPPHDRTPRSARAVRAAQLPHIPCTPPPGGVEAEHR
jgi:RNA polymerase sigma factor (sigma-70 family)